MNVSAFADRFRELYPNLYKNKSDEEVFNLIREKRPDLDIPTYQEAVAQNDIINKAIFKDDNILRSNPQDNKRMYGWLYWWV